MNKWRLAVAVFVLIFSLLITGCEAIWSSKEDESVPRPIDRETEATLKIAVEVATQSMKEYASYLRTQYPNVKVEFLSYARLRNSTQSFDSGFEQWVEEKKPDIIQFPMLKTFEKWVRDGKLLELGPLIKADDFDLENMNDHVIDYIRDKGEGKLFGLAPTFSSNVLFYNKQIFDRYHIEYPHNQMSWEEVLGLAGRFPAEGDETTKTYGYHHGSEASTFSLIKDIGRDQRLSYVDTDSTEITIDTPGWRRIFEMVLNGYKQGYVYNNKNPFFKSGNANFDDYIMSNMFTTGRAAMTLQNFMYLNLLEQKKIPQSSEWDIVTVPVDPTLPTESNYYRVSDLLGISADSPTLRAAWEFVKYANSDEVSKMKSKSLLDSQILTRTSHLKEVNGRSLEPFYMLEPSTFQEFTFTSSFDSQFDEMASEEINKILDGQQTLDEALKIIQRKGKELLAAESVK
ncbi:ABC transporter substrate-binding protein [Paenibacillus eucommiae]|uniref:Multiple sugar transport system substrate-binding protein n=1 Tax=Paenibacillus eucommiae TaxID=1355755 RepID=A0ABS4J160_9BACL|nr:extracellular solute-binding protein [Paenibacillus eucommiae]MBP1993578.1 multiple sugar transport system substrate-binding protein [Paenibacillus eucommiae]